MLHKDCLFHKYRDSILRLQKIEKSSIFSNDFLLCDDSDLKVYYSPHNEYINCSARIVIIGITPGWRQTYLAFQTAKTGLDKEESDERICFQCKMKARFEGTMRSNLVAMLDELGLQHRIGLPSCADLFLTDNNLLHTTSIIKYPCLYRDKNYGGHTPPIMDSHILRNYVENSFLEELCCIENGALVIPLGVAVETVFRDIGIHRILPQGEILWGFPHPSGLNAHRFFQFNRNRENLLQTILRCRLF